jgi:hypothetical protein
VAVERDTDPKRVRLVDANGIVVSIGESVDPYGDGYVIEFPLMMSGDGMSAASRVRSSNGNSGEIGPFLAEAAVDWRGVDGDRTWESLDHHLTVEVRRRTGGHVLLTFTLRRFTHGETHHLELAWSASATVTVEAGEEMSQLAAAVKELIAPHSDLD